jgi:large subunit ribosomal protein L29
MKPSEIRDLSVQEIEQRIAEDERELSQLRFRQAVAGLENPIILRDLRRDIARLKTILKEKTEVGG